MWPLPSEPFSPHSKKVASRGRVQGAAVEKTVKTILQAVERGGDKAVLRYTKQFDRVSYERHGVARHPEEIKEAYFHIRKDEGDALRFAAQRITSFHERQRIEDLDVSGPRGDAGAGGHAGRCGRRVRAGGKAVYPSSVLMCAIPAKVAGVSRVVMCTPPQKGPINPIYWSQPTSPASRRSIVSGACKPSARWPMEPRQSNASTKSWAPAIFMSRRPNGSSYGTVGIDMVAGPSELLVVADGDAKPAHVAADLLCEAEHDEDAQVYLVTTSAQLAKDVARLIEQPVEGTTTGKDRGEVHCAPFGGLRGHHDGRSHRWWPTRLLRNT